MKTSNSILLTIAGFLIALVIAGMFTLRNNVQNLVEIAERENKYESIPMDKFNRVDFSNQWVVRIRQGTDHKVEVRPEEGFSLKPSVENRNGTLYLDVKADTGSIYAKITTPSLRDIKAAKGSHITLEGFSADSISVTLEDGSFFTGKENDFQYISFKTSGEALVELIDDPTK